MTLFDAFCVNLEYDGDQHRFDRTQWNIDLDRNDAFADLGFVTIRVTSARMKKPRRVVRGGFDNVVKRGYVGPDSNFTAEWCSRFEHPV